MILIWKINNDLKNHICPFFLFSLCERGASLESLKQELPHSAVIIISYILSLYSLQKSHSLISFIWYSCEAVMTCTIISCLDIRKLRCREVMFLIWCHQAVEMAPRFPETRGVPSRGSHFPHKNVLPYCFYSYIILKISLKKCASL